MPTGLILTVNDEPIRTEGFVKAFVILTVSGMIESLKGTEAPNDLTLSIDGSKVKLNLNGKTIPTNVFASKIIRATMFGMVSVLKGVSETRKLTIEIHK